MLQELAFSFPALSFMIFLPVIGSVVLWLFDDEDLIKKSAAAIAGLELFLCGGVLWAFIPDIAAMQFSERIPWIPALGVSYHLAVDGISVLFLLATTMLLLLVVLFSWETVRTQVKEYYIALLGLEATLVGIFVSIDLVVFFVFWELMLIPSYFLIKLWGPGVERQYAALKYVLYTLLGSVFMLIGIVLLNLNYHEWAVAHRVEPSFTFDMLDLLTVPIATGTQILIFWLFFLGLAFKAPMVPFHTWLPDALFEGPIGMSVILAGVKLGTYGFVRFSLPLLPDASKHPQVVTAMVVLAIVGILYGAVIALVQSDLRRLLAFSSISHLGFVVLGVFALNFQGIQGGILTMINLSFSTAGLFFIAGFLYQRRHSTHLSSFGGMAQKTPLLATYFLIIGLASIGLPGTNGFVGEFLILLGAFSANWIYGAVAVTGVIFGAAYFLWYYERAMFGPLNQSLSHPLADLSGRELLIAVSLCVMIFWIGLYPSPFLRIMNGSVQAVVERVERGATAGIIASESGGVRRDVRDGESPVSAGRPSVALRAE